VLGRLAAGDRFRVARPLRPPDKFGAEHDVFLAEDGLRVVKFARNFGFVPIDLVVAELEGGLLELVAAAEVLMRRAPGIIR